MPTYNYRCKECDEEYQIFHSIMKDPVSICKYCKGEVERLIKGSNVGLIFKGSGFYLTDYKKISDNNQGINEKVNSQSKANSKQSKSDDDHV